MAKEENIRLQEWNSESQFHPVRGFEMRNFAVEERASRPNERMSIRCPFCKTLVIVFAISLACGKRCECGVLHTSTITIDDINIYGNKKEVRSRLFQLFSPGERI
jgi:hypothetical protein